MRGQSRALNKVDIIIGFVFGKDYSSCGMRIDCRRSESTATKGHNGFYQMRDGSVGSGDGQELDSRDT